MKTKSNITTQKATTTTKTATTTTRQHTSSDNNDDVCFSHLMINFLHVLRHVKRVEWGIRRGRGRAGIQVGRGEMCGSELGARGVQERSRRSSSRANMSAKCGLRLSRLHCLRLPSLPSRSLAYSFSFTTPSDSLSFDPFSDSLETPLSPSFYAVLFEHTPSLIFRFPAVLSPSPFHTHSHMHTHTYSIP